MCKTLWGGNYVRSKFSCVRSSHDLRERVHSLEGTLLESRPFWAEPDCVDESPCTGVDFSKILWGNQNIGGSG